MLPSSRKRRLTKTQTKSTPPSKQQKLNYVPPRLDHNARMALICFLTHKSREDNLLSSDSNEFLDIGGMSPSSSSSENEEQNEWDVENGEDDADLANLAGPLEQAENQVEEQAEEQNPLNDADNEDNEEDDLDSDSNDLEEPHQNLNLLEMLDEIVGSDDDYVPENESDEDEAVESSGNSGGDSSVEEESESSGDNSSVEEEEIEVIDVAIQQPPIWNNDLGLNEIDSSSDSTFNSSQSTSSSTQSDYSSDSEETTSSDANLDEENVFVNLLNVLENAVANDNSSDGSSFVSEDYTVRKLLLISRRFMNSYFTDPKHQVVLKTENDYRYFDLMVQWNKVCVGVFQLTAKALSALIKVAKMEKLHIMMYTMFETHPTDMRQAFKNWVQVCKAMRENTSLHSISIQTVNTRPSPYRMFFDTLPDKLTEIEAKNSVVHVLSAKRQKILNRLKLFDCTENRPDYSQIFKSKTKQLNLGRCASVLLNDLASCKILSKNPYIEHLKIGVLLLNYTKRKRLIKTQEFQKPNWSKIEEGLNCLKMVNPEMELSLVTGVFYGRKVNNLHHGIESVKEAIENTKLLIDLVKEMGFKSIHLKIKDIVNVSKKTIKILK